MEHKMGISDEEFREGGKEILEYIIEYFNTLSEREALKDIKPGFLRKQLPTKPPLTGGDTCSEVLQDFDRLMMRGIMHLNSSKFFGFYPGSTSYPSILASILCDGLSGVSYMRAIGRSCNELESIMMDWLAKAIDLPKCFWYEGKGPGCGNIQGTASEAMLVTLLAARKKAIGRKMAENKALSQHDVLSRLVCYTSQYAHSAVERAAVIAMVEIRRLPVDKDVSLRGETLRRAIEEDKAAGKIPFYVCATLGTTTCCSFDNIPEIGKICNEEDVWLHIDAAYAGNSFICPEFRHRMAGLELTDSFNFNPHKWLMVNFDCSALWVRNAQDMADSLRVREAVFMPLEEGGEIDYRDWAVPFGRRFRSLKLWFLFRMVGIEGMRSSIRRFVKLAKKLECLVKTDQRFEVLFPVELGLVCLRLVESADNVKRNRQINVQLVRAIQDSGELLVSPGEVGEKYFLRISVGSIGCDDEAIQHCWEVIKKNADIVTCARNGLSNGH